MTIRLTAVVLTAVLLLGIPGCAPHDKTAATTQNVSGCAKELNSIPELAALRKSQPNKESEADKPFEGLELALTINGMVTSHADTSNVDDLCYAQDSRESFDKLVAALSAHHMPPTVNFIEGQWFDPELQAEWLNSGNLLGNMGYERAAARKAGTKEFLEGLSRTDQLLESVSKGSLARKKYFRHPHPKSIGQNQDRLAVDAYLKGHGYVTTPATIQSPDRLFAQIYCGALADGNVACVSLVKASFFSLLLDQTTRARAEATRAAGRDIKHILVVHANQLTCDTLGEMLNWFRGLGARFIPIDEALSDSYYSQSFQSGER
jgi:hypothetical protein